MRRQKEQPISEALSAFLRESGLETPLLQLHTLQAWPNVVGEEIAKRSRAIKINAQTLYVEVNSTSLCTELQMQRSSLVEKLNAAVGSHVIYDIRFRPNELI